MTVLIASLAIVSANAMSVKTIRQEKIQQDGKVIPATTTQKRAKTASKAHISTTPTTQSSSKNSGTATKPSAKSTPSTSSKTTGSTATSTGSTMSANGKSVGTDAKGRALFQGPKGGKYYMSNGKKVYVK